MNSFDREIGWERYARSMAEAWEKDHARQIVAYQQLGTEMNRLMELLLQSQQNQNEFMKESARQLEYCIKGFEDLRGELSNFLQEARQFRVNNDVSEQVGFLRLNARIEDVLVKLDNFATSFPISQHSSTFVVRESGHLMNSSMSNLPQQSPTSLIQESQELIRQSKSSPSPTINQESVSRTDVPSQQFPASFKRESNVIS